MSSHAESAADRCSRARQSGCQTRGKKGVEKVKMIVLREQCKEEGERISVYMTRSETEIEEIPSCDSGD